MRRRPYHRPRRSYGIQVDLHHTLASSVRSAESVVTVHDHKPPRIARISRMDRSAAFERWQTKAKTRWRRTAPRCSSRPRAPVRIAFPRTTRFPSGGHSPVSSAVVGRAGFDLASDGLDPGAGQGQTGFRLLGLGEAGELFCFGEAAVCLV